MDYCREYCIPAARRAERETECGIPFDEEEPSPRPGPGPCSNQPPPVSSANLQAWNAWGMVADQWRAGGLDVVGFDLPGASAYLERFGLDSPDTLLKLRLISQVALSQARKRNKP